MKPKSFRFQNSQAVLFLILSLGCTSITALANSELCCDAEFNNEHLIYIDEAVDGLHINKQVDASTLHLFTHGKSGQLLIEGEWRGPEEVANWLKNSRTLDGQEHLNIYGCEFAKGQKGKEAVAYLEEKPIHQSGPKYQGITSESGRCAPGTCGRTRRYVCNSQSKYLMTYRQMPWISATNNEWFDNTHGF